jgi:hypothetical protein
MMTKVAIVLALVSPALDAAPAFRDGTLSAVGRQANGHCAAQCLEAHASRQAVAIWLVTNGKRQFIGDYRPDWERSHVAAPTERIQRYTFPLGDAAATTSASCGADGWGYVAGETIASLRLPGGAWATWLYTGEGEALLVREYANGKGDTTIARVVPHPVADTERCTQRRLAASG